MTPKEFRAACIQNAQAKDTCAVKYEHSLYFPKHVIIKYNNLGQSVFTGVVESVLSRKEMELPIRQLEFHTRKLDP